MRRGGLAFVVGIVALAATGAPASAAPALTYGCSPPLPATAAGCYVWHTGPVKLAWDWDQTLAQPISGMCTIQTFSKDTTGLPVACEVQDLTDLSTTKLTAVLRIDATPPTIERVEPARAADYDGWWTHGVTFAFSGSDATSGIAACDVVPYTGPDGANAEITGACRDQAGNVATRAFGFKYDATPPSLTGVAATPGNRIVRISWSASADTVASQLVRTPGVGSAPQSTLLQGVGTVLTDDAVSNGTTYRYTVSTYDAAGNASSTAVSATPSRVYALSPARNARLNGAPVLRWPPASNARYYNVQLFRGKRKVLSAWPAGHHLRLHRTWRFHGRRYRLTAGHYRWFVWPGFGPRAEHRYGRMIAQSSFFIIRR
jgi:hypothetical protein